MRVQRTWAALGVAVLLMSACASAATPTPTLAPSSKSTPTPAARLTPTPAPTPTLAPTPAPSPTRAPAGPKLGGVARHPQRTDPPTWDPSKETVDPVGTSKYLVFTKLFTKWSDNPAQCQAEVYPWAVASWKWLSDTVAEFTLKPGIRFQNRPPANGREMVASDAVASFQRFRNVPFMKVHSDKIDSVTATGKYTFQIKAKFPWGGLAAEMLAFQYGVWVEPAEITGADWDWSADPPKAWLGSGPFILKRWIPAVKWTFERNPNYWVPGKPYLDAVEYPVMPDASVHMAALRSGQLSVVRDLAEPMIDELQKRFVGFQVIRCPGGSTSGAGGFWMNNSGPPFNDVRVRRAVAMAIDRQSIIDTLYSRKAAYVTTAGPSMQYAMTLQDFPAEARQFLEYHPDRARQLLAEAGYANGFDTTINFTGRYAAPAAMVAEALVDMLKAVGIRAKLNMMEYTRFLDVVIASKYPVGDMAISPVDATTPEGALSLASFYSKTPGGRNRSLVNEPEYDKLFERFISVTDEKERQTLARQLQTMAADKAYRLLLPFPDSTMSLAPGVHLTWIGNTRDYGNMMETMWIE